MACVIPHSEMEAIHAHLSGVYPEEGCGLLVGRDLEEERRVALAVAVRNAERGRRRRYAIDPEEFLAAERRARADGLEVVGFYHSHPDREAEPSPTDRDRAWPHYSYLIVSVREGRALEARCWRARSGEMVSEPVRVEPSAGGAS